MIFRICTEFTIYFNFKINEMIIFIIISSAFYEISICRTIIIWFILLSKLKRLVCRRTFLIVVILIIIFCRNHYYIKWTVSVIISVFKIWLWVTSIFRALVVAFITFTAILKISSIIKSFFVHPFHTKLSFFPRN